MIYNLWFTNWYFWIFERERDGEKDIPLYREERVNFKFDISSILEHYWTWSNILSLSLSVFDLISIYLSVHLLIHKFFVFNTIIDTSCSLGIKFYRFDLNKKKVDWIQFLFNFKDFKRQDLFLKFMCRTICVFTWLNFK